MQVMDAFEAQFGTVTLRTNPIGEGFLTLCLRNTCAVDFPEARVAMNADELRATATMLAEAADELEERGQRPVSTAGIEVSEGEAEHVVLEMTPMLTPTDEADLAS